MKDRVIPMRSFFLQDYLPKVRLVLILNLAI